MMGWRRDGVGLFVFEYYEGTVVEKGRWFSTMYSDVKLIA